jgi:hypothetical protein
MPSTLKNAIVVHNGISDQGLGNIRNVVPEKMEEIIENGFDPPCQLFASDSVLVSDSDDKKVLEVDIKRKLSTYITESLTRQKVIAFQKYSDCGYQNGDKLCLGEGGTCCYLQFGFENECRNQDLQSDEVPFRNGNFQNRLCIFDWDGEFSDHMRYH